jgi:hypothetical protein
MLEDSLLVDLACLFKVCIILVYNRLQHSTDFNQKAYNIRCFGNTAGESVNGGKNEIPQQMIFMIQENNHYESLRLNNHFKITREVYDSILNEDEKRVVHNLIKNTHANTTDCGTFLDNLASDLMPTLSGALG